MPEPIKITQESRDAASPGRTSHTSLKVEILKESSREHSRGENARQYAHCKGDAVRDRGMVLGPGDAATVENGPVA